MKSFILSIPNGLASVIMVLIVMFFTFVNNPLGVNSLRIFPYAEQVGHFILYFITALVFILDYAKTRLPHHSKINQEIAFAAVASVLALMMEIGLMIYTVTTCITLYSTTGVISTAARKRNNHQSVLSYIFRQYVWTIPIYCLNLSNSNKSIHRYVILGQNQTVAHRERQASEGPGHGHRR